MSRKVVMQRDPDEMGLFSLATFQTMRLEALDLFDRCLAESKPEYLEHFLEQQVTLDPPPLELLSQIAEDVHQRLLVLRQQQFDARDHFRRTLQHQYGFDVSPFFPPDPLEYHRLNLDEAMRFIGDQHPEIRPVLRQLLQDALSNAAQLYVEMTLADHLYNFVMDWLMALHIVSVRGAWADDMSGADTATIH